MAVITARLCTVNQPRMRSRNGPERRGANVPSAATATTDEDPSTMKSSASATVSVVVPLARRISAGRGDHERIGGRVDPEQEGGEVGDVLDRAQPARQLRRRRGISGVGGRWGASRSD